MNRYETLLLIMGAALFAVMLAIAVIECIREMRAETVKRRPATRSKRPLYVEDLRKG